MESQKEPDLNRRKYLKGALAAAVGFTFLKKGIDKAMSGTNPTDFGADKLRESEAPEDLKDRNTRIEVEKNILSSFGPEDIGILLDGQLPHKKIFQFTEGANRVKAVVASNFTAMVNSLAQRNLLHNQPSLPIIQIAQDNVVKWLIKIRSNERFYATSDSLQEVIRNRIEELSEQQR